MGRVAAILVVVTLGWTIAAAAAQAGAQVSPKRAQSATAACVKRTPVKKAAKPRARSARGVTKAKAAARLYAGTLVRTGRSGSCLKRSAASTSQSASAKSIVPGAAALPAPAPAATAPVVADPAPAPLLPPPLLSTLGVEAHDLGSFVLRLTRTTVAAGNLTIYFRNLDFADHNLWLLSPEPDPGAVRISEDVGYLGAATKTVAVTPGSWHLFCSLPGHSSMDRTLTVS